MIETISSNDDMYVGNRAIPRTAAENAPYLTHYFKCGAELAAYTKSRFSQASGSLLEIPCGHGRVTRHLINELPEADLWTADVLPDAIEFQRAVLHTNSILVGPALDYSEIPDGRFGTILVGSLITHLTEANTLKFLEAMSRKLTGNGQLIVTTKGLRAYEILKNNKRYQISDESRGQLLAKYEARSFGFVEYEEGHFEANAVREIGKSYGTTLIHKDWLVEAIKKFDMRQDDYVKGGWDDHQDIFSFVRAR